MLKKGLKAHSILTGSCPRCNEESMYAGKNLYNPSYTIKMNEKCSHCGLQYSMEPSFFYGSMYVSYALGVGLGVAAFILFYFGLKTNLKTAFIGITATLILLMPVLMRVSRNVWINFFISYDKDWAAKK
ncbi:DUF983 domain-containing protein [Flavobacterium amnicola]|jgi:uncharacterized protein (DUF983 family)|uniref:DUF983 domain-containing protein n=1 Tax=Flavobacterium amnicola TaxID=2506422 RepID=A0A4Q1K3X0_9FLAO|nr:DUF983 domain-containing protein [Flavobacterium amnicola]RXR20513.1 DUF983 domain-containing protein [Flavobacterium amnicola]